MLCGPHRSGGCSQQQAQDKSRTGRQQSAFPFGKSQERRRTRRPADSPSATLGPFHMCLLGAFCPVALPASAAVMP